MRSVAGRTAVITGGASGMGLLWAKHFAMDGARVVIWDLDESALAKAVLEIGKHCGCTVTARVVDVTDRAAIEKAAAADGPVDILVNNAGIVAGGPFLEVPPENHAKTLDVDLSAVLWTTQAMLPGMIKRGKGDILNVASAAGFIGVPYMAAYTASKWAVIGFTESLRLEMRELGYRGIRFTLLCPGFVNTGMFAGVKSPLLMPLLDPERFVAKAYRAYRKGKYLVREPFIVRIAGLLRWGLPTPLADWIIRAFGFAAAMRSWTGRTPKDSQGGKP